MVREMYIPTRLLSGLCFRYYAGVTELGLIGCLCMCTYNVMLRSCSIRSCNRSTDDILRTIPMLYRPLTQHWQSHYRGCPLAGPTVTHWLVPTVTHWLVPTATRWLVPTVTHWLVLTNTTPGSVLPDSLRTLFQLPAPLRPQHQDRIATCHGLCPHDRHSELRHTRQPAAPSGGISCRDDRRTAPLAVTSTDRHLSCSLPWHGSGRALPSIGLWKSTAVEEPHHVRHVGRKELVYGHWPLMSS